MLRISLESGEKAEPNRLKLPELLPPLALAATISLLATAACRAVDDEGWAAQETAMTSPTTKSGAPAFPLETPTLPDNRYAAEEIETAPRKPLADGLDVEDFRLDSYEGVGGGPMPPWDA